MCYTLCIISGISDFYTSSSYSPKQSAASKGLTQFYQIFTMLFIIILVTFYEKEYIDHLGFRTYWSME